MSVVTGAFGPRDVEHKLPLSQDLRINDGDVQSVTFLELKNLNGTFSGFQDTSTGASSAFSTSSHCPKAMGCREDLP
jgi:hypothetical protein